MPLGLPVVLEVADHAAVAHLPQKQPVFLDLLHGWPHKKGARMRSPLVLSHVRNQCEVCQLCWAWHRLEPSSGTASCFPWQCGASSWRGA